jgi:hypothetical protein
VFGITRPTAGHAYAVAGLRIEYTYRGQSYSVIAWAGAAACVAANWRSSFPTCDPFVHAVNLTQPPDAPPVADQVPDRAFGPAAAS